MFDFFFKNQEKQHVLRLKFSKTQGRTQKLNGKTQNSRKKLNLSDFRYSPSIQMFKKMPAVGGVSSLKCVKMHIPGSTGDG